MNKITNKMKLDSVMLDMHTIMWDVIDKLGDLDLTEDYEELELLDMMTDMYERYERDLDVE